jgi:hypothetical protein
VTPCAVYTVHVETRSAGFLIEPQNQGQRFVSGLVSKPLGRVSRFGPQNQQLRFADLGLKSPRRFLGLGLKTQRALICLLHHKIDGGRRRGTHVEI